MFGSNFLSLRRLAQTAAMFGAMALAGCGAVSLPGAGSGPKIDPNAPVPVALLVPSGSGQQSDAFLAKSIENAARLAIADLQGASIDLRVYGTAGDPGTAAGVAVQAVNEGAKVILGPVYGAAANAAGAAVAPSGVNVLSFSNNTDIAGGNVFVIGNTFQNTADRLVQYAVGQGKNSILIVNAQDVAEEKGRTAIATAIARFGATQAGSSAFELSQKGVSAAIPRITSAAKSSGADAVFFTSGTSGALPILTQLLSENGLRSSDAQYIGLQRWDIPAQALELGPLQNGWFAVPSPANLAQFNSKYSAAYGAEPHPISALGYDGIAAIGALIAGGKRDALSVARLTQSTGFAGVNGVFRLRADGTNERGLAVATIRNNKLVVIDPAPRSFGGAGF